MLNIKMISGTKGDLVEIVERQIGNESSDSAGIFINLYWFSLQVVMIRTGL